MTGEAVEASRIIGKFSLAGKVALVTGASRGIGQALAMGLAEAGADMALVARSEEALKETAEMARALGRRAAAVPADVSQVQAIRGMVDRVIEEYGRIDILLNGAGTQARIPSLELTEEDWDRVSDLNLKAVFFCSQAVAPHMIEQGKGKIINVASLTSTLGFAGIAVYGATKGGVLSLTRSLSTEWSKLGINVNALAPGYFKTEMTRRLWQDPERDKWVLSRTPQGRWGDLADLQGAAVFLASDASDFITGQMINVDGGWLAS
jgi:2-deoxy-D-gluconate 3-dehydrogenase